MKNLFFGSMIIFCLLVFSGCSDKEKKLVCSVDASKVVSLPSGVKAYQNSEIVYSHNKLKSMEMTFKIECDTSILVENNDIYSSLKQIYEEQFSGFNGITVKTDKVSDQYFNITILYDVDKMDKEVKEIFKIDQMKSFDDTKKILEEKGYVCE